MAASKKRRTSEAPQSTTLHNFFGRRSAVQSKKPQTKPSKPKLSEPKAKGKQKERPPPEDIIVIDSDSDVELCEVTQIPRAQPTTSARGRDVLAEENSGGGKRVKRSRSPSISFVNEEERPATSASLTVPLTSHTRGGSPFGTPILLLGISSPTSSAPASSDVPPFTNSATYASVTDSSSNECSLTMSGSSFGTPSVLTTRCKSCGNRSPTRRSPHHSPGPGSYTPFGFPATLLPPSSPALGKRLVEEPSASDIRSPISLVEINARSASSVPSSALRNRSEADCPPGVPPCSSTSSGVDLIMDYFDINEEWGLGDDEVTLLDPDPEEGDIDDMEEVDVEIDVDMPSEPSAPLRPLSSLRTPPNVPSSSKRDKPNPKLSSDAFSVLMSSYKENEAWKEATIAEDRNFRPTKQNGGRRKAPFYKVLQGMPIAVDAFRYGSIPGVEAYFLTHAHSDHYTNLSSNWKSGPIYCSEGTANLIIHMLDVDPKWVHPLPLDVPTVIPNTGGVQVTPIEANHCPGSCLFLFEGPQTINAGDSAYKSPFVGSQRVFRYLHCGDFRASPKHVLHPAVKGKKIDHVYLDTTYLDPKYCFPPQPLVISACAELASRIVKGQPTSGKGSGPGSQSVKAWLKPQEKSDSCAPDKSAATGKVLVVVGTYSIGKERIVKAIAHALDSKVYCDRRKAAILRCQDDPELHALLTPDPLDAVIHVVPLSVITSDRLKEYVERFKGHFDRAVGFRPTGWTFTQPSGSDTLPSISSVLAKNRQRPFTHADLTPQRNSTLKFQLYGVPYSEHSSFYELTCFALSLDWGKMIATVNVGSERSRARMRRWVDAWERERKGHPKDYIVSPREADYW